MLQKFIIKPGERYQTKIAIDTRKGNDIDNIQEYDLTPFYLELNKRFKQQYTEPRATFVNEPSSIYNCHGLTFGSRRSAIWNPEEVRKILKEDDYKIINDMNDIRAGDIIIYSNNMGDIGHSGLVIGKKQGLPLILSKWGYGGEVVHPFNQCPYIKNNPIVEYFRISK